MEKIKKTEQQLSADERLKEILRGDFDERLRIDDFEIAQGALDDIRDLRAWREAGCWSEFGDFYSFFEEAAAVSGADLPTKEKVEIKKALAEKVFLKKLRLSPRAADLFSALLAEFSGESREPHFKETGRKLKELKSEGNLEILFHPKVKFADKIDLMEARFEGYLNGVSALDGYERKKAYEEKKKEKEEVDTPPPAREESKPGMDETKRLPEGEKAPAIWSISPARGGYLKEQSFDSWDGATNTWRSSGYKYSDVEFSDVSGATEKLKIAARVRANEWIRLPLFYNYEIAAIKSGENDCTVKKDQNGDCVIMVKDDKFSKVGVSVTLIPQDKKLSATEEPKAMEFPSALTKETEDKLEEIKNTKSGNLSKANALAVHAMRRLKYSNNSSLNIVYDNYSRGFIAAIDETREADCDVANTYFAALCSRLNIPARHCVGHMVKGKDETGASRITSGTGHAWSEIWDEINREWTRIDATPPGDPQFSEKGEEESEHIPGDYGAPEAVGPTDEYLAELEKKLAERAEELSYTEEEREISEVTGIELKKAREVMKEIREAEDVRLPNGELIRDQLSRLFNAIIESRKKKFIEYIGPVRKREGGGEIDDVVAHYIGVKSKEADPLSRKKKITREKEEKLFGGFDVYMIGDKSGSMRETVDGEAKWKMQRRAWFLIFAALHRFEENVRRAEIVKENSLSVRTQGISFRDSATIDSDKPLSEKFLPQDKVNLWQSLGNQGFGNGDTAALTHILNQIKKERGEIEKKGKKDDRLRIVIACSDGYPDNAVKVQGLAEGLGKLNAVVVGVGLTETAKAVEKIFTTKWSRGDWVEKLEDLPIIVAKHIIMEAVKLFPEKSKANAQYAVKVFLDKFKKDG